MAKFDIDGDLVVEDNGNITVSGTVDGRDVATDGTKLDTIETNADVTDTANVTSAGALMDSEVTNLADVKAFDPADYATAAQGATADTSLQPDDVGLSVQPYSAVLTATTASFTTADETKLDHITVSQAVDLDAMETRLDALDASIILMGTWDASGGSFPGGGTAQAGESWIVSTGGTVDGEEFTANDRIVAITDDASTTTYASNWHKLDYTDAVLSVNSQTGAVVLDADDISDAATTNKFTTAADISKLAGIEAGADVTDATNVAAAGGLLASNNLSEVSVGMARSNLGLGDLATEDNVSNADWDGTPLSTSNGGTSATDIATARTNLGLAIGTDVQAYSAVLAATTASFTTADESKLDGIEALADVTDAANVESAIEAISLTAVSGATGDEVLVVDATDGGLKAVLWQNLPGASGSGIENVVEDTTPELGGDLAVGAYKITGTSDVELEATGDVVLDAADDVVIESADNFNVEVEDWTYWGNASVTDIAQSRVEQMSLVSGVAQDIPMTATRGAWLIVISGDNGNSLNARWIGVVAKVGAANTAVINTLVSLPNSSGNALSVTWPTTGNQQPQVTISETGDYNVMVLGSF